MKTKNQFATARTHKTELGPPVQIETQNVGNQSRSSGASTPITCFATVWLAMLIVTIPCTMEAQVTNGVFVPGSTNYGKGYAEWLVAWHQWADSLETIHHPLFDTADLSAGQTGPVWFLGLDWDSNSNPVTNRTGVVPVGRALFVVIADAFADNTGCPTNYNSETQLRELITPTMDQVHDLTFNIDGAAVRGLLPSYRFQSPVFTFMTPPNNNFLEALEGEPCYSQSGPTPAPWTVTGAVADGVGVLLDPLALGPHTLNFSGQYGNPTSASWSMTYHLSVLDTNLGNPAVFPPDSAPFGKTYAQWSAEMWKWLYSLPIDRNPLYGSADPSAGQSSNVWFLGGVYTNGVLGGTAVRNTIIPDGRAIFIPLLSWESSTAEGNGSGYGQLFANSQFLIDHATNLSITIDGQPVQNIEHYRAQSQLYTWGPLPTNNVFGDPVNFPAGLTSLSVADGYYVMLAPLPAGTHTLHFTGGIKTSVANGDPFDSESELDITYNLTVMPASLNLVQQGSSLMISWPQTTTTYVLEQTDGLMPAHWSPSGASVQAFGGSYQAMIPKSSGSQFFRLRKQ